MGISRLSASHIEGELFVSRWTILVTAKVAGMAFSSNFGVDRVAVRLLW